jgi:peptide/nickel transport system substrate-binding protein
MVGTGKARLHRRLFAPWAIGGAILVIAASLSALTSTPVLAASGGGSTLTIANVGSPTTMDPEKLDNGGGDTEFAELAYDSLVEETASATYVPDLATSWNYVGKGNTEFEFHIRAHVRFSDGSTMTAQDVVNTIDAERGAGTTCASDIDTLTSATATGPLTVLLKYSAPAADVEATFDQNGMCGEVLGPRATGTQTDGTGPYELDSSATVTGSSYVYVQNPYYWDTSLRRFKKVVVTAYASPEEAFNAVRSGQADFAVGEATEASAAEDAGLKIYASPGGIQALYLTDFGGTLVPALANQKVREAISYAIDRKALATALYGKYATPNDQMLVPGYQGYVPADADYYPYDPAKARQLLKEAGYPHGFTFWTIASADEGFENTVQGVVGYLSKVGITVNIKQDPTHNEAVTDMFNRKYPSFVWGFGAQPMPSAAPELYGPQALFNPFHNPQSHMVDLLNQANATAGASATRIYQQAETYSVQQAWNLTLFDVDTIYFAKPGTIANIQVGLPKYPSPGGPDIAFWSPPK